MHIAVTGASGRVGRAVTALLVERGHRVLGLDLVAPREPVDGAEYLVGDLADLPAADPRLADVEAVAHLGAYMSWNPADAEKLFQANVTATMRLIRALGSSVQRFVLASTGEVYPENSPAYQPLDEDHPRLPTTWYGESKVLAEELVAFAGRSNGWDTVVLRFSHTQDPAEILDPDSFFSGPRFFASRRLERERAAGNAEVVAALEPYAATTGRCWWPPVPTARRCRWASSPRPTWPRAWCSRWRRTRAVTRSSAWGRTSRPTSASSPASWPQRPGSAPWR